MVYILCYEVCMIDELFLLSMMVIKEIQLRRERDNGSDLTLSDIGT